MSMASHAADELQAGIPYSPSFSLLFITASFVFFFFFFSQLSIFLSSPSSPSFEEENVRHIELQHMRVPTQDSTLQDSNLMREPTFSQGSEISRESESRESD